MLEFLVDNIFAVFAGKVFQQMIGIPMDTNCSPRLADIFLYSYEAIFILSLLSAGKKQLASHFNLIYRYIDDVFSKTDFTQTLRITSVRCIPWKTTLLLPTWICSFQSIESSTSYFPFWQAWRFQFPYYKRIFLGSNIPSSPAYGVFISQIIR